MRTVLMILFSAMALFVQGQEETGSWTVLNIKYKFDDKWSIFGEGQLRSLKVYDHFHYYEYKGGINYKVHKYVRLTLGTGSYQTHREGGNFVLPKVNDEFRIWPQLILFQSIGDLKLEQRFRSEMRFTSNGYRNRYRYRMGLTYDFGFKANKEKPFQISAGNEIFLTNNAPYFERNRATIALNYYLSKNSDIQLGYVYQYDYQLNRELSKGSLVLGFYHELFRQKIPENKIEHDVKDN